MRAATAVWSALLLGAGLAVATGAFPGPAPATGPRIGIAALLLMVGFLLLAVPAVQWVLRKTTKPADYAGGCPVGGRCACGTFNLKPRTACKGCQAALAW